MRFAILFLCMFSFSVSAGVYKWTDANGQVHFGSQPPPGQSEEVEIRKSSPGAMGSERRYTQPAATRQAREPESAEQRYRDRVSEIRQDYDQRPDYVCTGANDRLKSAEERWHNAKLQGYTLSEKNYHEQNIKELKRHRDNICR